MNPIARLLSAIGRKIVGDDPTPQPSVLDVLDSGAPLSIPEAQRFLADAAPLSDVETIAIAAGAMVTRGPAWSDTTPLGVYRRAALAQAERQQLQADAEGMEVAHHDLLLASGKSGTHIPDVLAMEATAYLEGEAR